MVTWNKLQSKLKCTVSGIKIELKIKEIKCSKKFHFFSRFCLKHWLTANNVKMNSNIHWSCVLFITIYNHSRVLSHFDSVCAKNFVLQICKQIWKKWWTGYENYNHYWFNYLCLKYSMQIINSSRSIPATAKSEF